MNDEVVEWRTTFDVSDAPHDNRLDSIETKHEMYSRLAVANTLDWNGKWRDENRVTEKTERHIIDALSSQLELTDFQKDRAQKLYYDSREELLPSYSIETLSLCAVGLSGNADGRNYHPNNLLRSNESKNRYAELAIEVGVSHSKLLSCWTKMETWIEQ